MHQRQRQHACRVLFCGQHSINEAAHGLDRRLVHRDHAAVDVAHDRPGFARRRVRRQAEQVFGALADIGVRILLVEDQQIGGLEHRFGQMRMRIEFRTDRRRLADHFAHSAQQVAFAVRVAVGHHGPVQAQQYDVDGHRRLQLVEDLVTVALIDAANGGSGRLRKRTQAFNKLPVAALCLLFPDMQRHAEEHRRSRRAVPVGDERVLVGRQPGRQRRERTALRRQACDEHFHIGHTVSGVNWRTR